MSAAVPQALNLVWPTLIPAILAMLGALLGTVWRPGPHTRSSVQHFTAGVVLAAVGAELLPELGAAPPLGMALGFLLGGGAMLAIRALVGEEEDDEAEGAPAGRGSTGLMVTVGVDLLVDGLLCAVTLAAVPESGLVVVAALSLEVFFLGLATVVTLGGGGPAMAKMSGLALLVPVGALIGAAAFSALPAVMQTGILAFATAALLYLVAEELLAEAHEGTRDNTYSAGAFFLGFLAVLLLNALGG
ncbi:ZIP family metal transporter [Xanthobacter sediminis]|uniref:ZIP family metal transporter n=1 Tax=Xanthobacter sediminis TaxID=3119926 RepID=UPI00372BAE68